MSDTRPRPPTAPLAPALATLVAEATAVTLLLLTIALGTLALEHPASALHQAVGSPLWRRLAMGAVVGAVIVALTYSPLGRRSGAQLNPAVSLALVRAGRLPARALGPYVAAQLVGALAGVALAVALAGPHLAHPDITYAVTRFDDGAWPLAFAVEFALGFALMALILFCTQAPRWAPRTGLMVGLAVIVFVGAGGPVSGASMNPWRSLASAWAAGDFAHLWLYCLAPPLGTLAASEIFRRVRAPLPLASPRGFEPLSPP